VAAYYVKKKKKTWLPGVFLFSATDVNDTFDDDEADPVYNVLADEEKETGEKLLLFS
jgi:hypothetical protein